VEKEPLDQLELFDLRGLGQAATLEIPREAGQAEAPTKQPGHPLRTLGQDLEGVLFGLAHDVEHRANKLRRDAGMEQIAHRVHEHEPWPSPRQGQRQDIAVQTQPETRAAALCVAADLVPGIAHGLQPAREVERVAVLTAVAHTVTPGGWIPGGFY
jgi:hypothetical protein